MAETVEIFLRSCLLLDLEVDRRERRILRLGAVRPDSEEPRALALRGSGRRPVDPARLVAELERFSAGASRVLGHNLLHHDLPVLRGLTPSLDTLRLPVVDTLYLSALAFPERPYHRLVKDYRLVRRSVNDPVADAELAGELFRDIWTSLGRQDEKQPGLVAFYARCFDDDALGDRGGTADLLRRLAVLDQPATLDALVEGRACRLIVDQLADEDRPGVPALAYAVAWLRVAGEDSVLPGWIRRRFPEMPRLLDRLRRSRSTGEPCAAGEACSFCGSVDGPEGELKRYFGFERFRDEPRDDAGDSLQRRIVVEGLAKRSHLAVLATGAGKSVCYQLPALVSYRRRGTLTVVISPLQALMKDQVEGLNRRIGAERAAALNGLLTPPERGQVLERVRSGEIALLYVAPEQLRNRSFQHVVETRELAAWVYDEAHCLSKWGHDFRPDYLFAARFVGRLAKEQGEELPAIFCYTATAKKDVVAEILAHFEQELGLELGVFAGRVDREELRFFVEAVPPLRKLPRIAELLTERFGDGSASGSTEGAAGSAVVYFARRRATEEAARFLEERGLSAAAFHAGLAAPRKREVLEAFIAGDLPVVCATNAFGMGIDKDDVRLVIHGDIPGSLEAYLQEAGRAGRDRRESDCILLFDEGDVERQFKLTAASKLEKTDLEEILRAVRRAVKKRPDGVVALTSGELLRDEDLDLPIRPDDWQADTQVRTALAWLERAGFLERGHNRTWVFQGKLGVKNLEQARQRMLELRWSPAVARRRLGLLEALLQSTEDRGLSVDDLAQRLSPRDLDGQGAGNVVIRDLQALSKAGLIDEGLQLTAYLRPKGKGNAVRTLEGVARLERAMIEALQEEDPDAESGSTVRLSLRRLNQRLLDRGETSTPEILRALLKSLSEDGRGLAGSHGSLDLRYLRRGHYAVRLRRDWSTLSELADRRRQVARVALDALVSKVSSGSSGQVLVAFSLDDVVAAVERDLVLRQTVRDSLAAAERALLFLHEHRAIQLQNGLAVFRQAMTLSLQQEKKGRRYTHGDYQPLAEHYDERTFQVHVMARYAEEARVRLRRGLELVQDYFEHGRDELVAKWFRDQDEELHRATGADSYRRIVEDLGNTRQQAVVTAPLDRHLLVLAGPGSGKTRVVVHRCAFLLRVERVPARSVLVVCFNHAAAAELRKRLWNLVGEDARGVTVCTYHALALRLLGRSFSEGFDGEALDRLVPDAVSLLESEEDLPGLDSDEIRDRLLAGFRHILVDEYQDVNESQYRLIAAVAGLSLDEPGRELTLLAVGDDDQTIYDWNGANVRYIRRFQQDYGVSGEGSVHHLVECYRSTKHIVDAANHLVAHNRDRMKTEHPIRVDRARRNDPPGEPVRLHEVGSVEAQAAAVADRIAELRSREETRGDRVGVLGRTHQVLEPVLAVLKHRLPEESAVRLRRGRDLPRSTRIREIVGALRELHEEPRKERTASQVLDALEGSDPWTALLREILEAWREESRDEAFDAGTIREFIYEALAEQGRVPAPEDGTVLSTLHAAKGLEFDHVFVLDGGWKRPKDPLEIEGERRLYYVGMTRAKTHLHLFTGIDGPNPHAALFDGRHAFLTRDRPSPEVPPRSVWGRRWELTSLEDVYLSWAGRQGAGVQARIAAVATGDEVFFRHEQSGRLAIADSRGETLTTLSTRGEERWRPLLARIESARIYAWVERRAEDSEPDYRSGLRQDRWQVPVVEVILGDGHAVTDQ